MPFAMATAPALPCLTCKPQWNPSETKATYVPGSSWWIKSCGSCHTTTFRKSKFFQMRPKGKWLVLGSQQRYLLGRETLVLMGFPLHRMRTMNLPESVTWLTHTIGTWCGWVCQEIWCLLLIPAPKVLQDLGGNSMSVRVVMAVLAAALRATDPQKMTQSWKMPMYVQANVVFNFFGVLGNHGKSNPN